MKASRLVIICICLWHVPVQAAALSLSGDFRPGAGGGAAASWVVRDTMGQFAVGHSSGANFTVEHGLWNSGIRLVHAKAWANGADVSVSEDCPPVVTALFPGGFYAEQDGHAGGMWVAWPFSVPVGTKVAIAGETATTAEFEKCIVAECVAPAGEGTAVPAFVANKALGGCDWQYDPVTGAGQRGVEDVDAPPTGLNNIGLLVTVSGKVTFVGGDYFYIDDGSHAHDFSILNGVRVRSGALTKPTSDQHVFVTGISSIMIVNGRLFRSVRPRTQEDIHITQ